MPQINQLSSVDALSSADQIPIYDSSNGDARKLSIDTLRAWMADNLDIGKPVTQYAAPSATGFVINITQSVGDVHLILAPGGNYAAGTINLPHPSLCVDKQTVTANSSMAVTALTVNGNGADIKGTPVAFVANGYWTLKFDSLMQTWYRVG